MHTKPSNFFLLDIKKTSGILGEKKVKLELEGLNIKHKEALWITAVAQGPTPSQRHGDKYLSFSM